MPERVEAVATRVVTSSAEIAFGELKQGFVYVIPLSVSVSPGLSACFQAKVSQTGHESVVLEIGKNPFPHQCLVNVHIVALQAGQVQGRILLHADRRLAIPITANVLSGRDYERQQRDRQAKLVSSITSWCQQKGSCVSPGDELSRLFKQRAFGKQIFFEVPDDSRYPFGHPPTIKERMFKGKEDEKLLNRPYSARAGRIDDDGGVKNLTDAWSTFTGHRPLSPQSSPRATSARSERERETYTKVAYKAKQRLARQPPKKPPTKKAAVRVVAGVGTRGSNSSTGAASSQTHAEQRMQIEQRWAQQEHLIRNMFADLLDSVGDGNNKIDDNHENRHQNSSHINSNIGGISGSLSGLQQVRLDQLQALVLAELGSAWDVASEQAMGAVAASARAEGAEAALADARAEGEKLARERAEAEAQVRELEHELILAEVEITGAAGVGAGVGVRGGALKRSGGGEGEEKHKEEEEQRLASQEQHQHQHQHQEVRQTVYLKWKHAEARAEREVRARRDAEAETTRAHRELRRARAEVAAAHSLSEAARGATKSTARQLCAALATMRRKHTRARERLTRHRDVLVQMAKGGGGVFTAEHQLHRFQQCRRYAAEESNSLTELLRGLEDADERAEAAEAEGAARQGAAVERERREGALALEEQRARVEAAEAALLESKREARALRGEVARLGAEAAAGVAAAMVVAGAGSRSGSATAEEEGGDADCAAEVGEMVHWQAHDRLVLEHQQLQQAHRAMLVESQASTSQEGSSSGSKGSKGSKGSGSSKSLPVRVSLRLALEERDAALASAERLRLQCQQLHVQADEGARAARRARGRELLAWKRVALLSKGANANGAGTGGKCKSMHSPPAELGTAAVASLKDLEHAEATIIAQLGQLGALRKRARGAEERYALAQAQARRLEEMLAVAHAEQDEGADALRATHADMERLAAVAESSLAQLRAVCTAVEHAHADGMRRKEEAQEEGGAAEARAEKQAEDAHLGPETEVQLHQRLQREQASLRLHQRLLRALPVQYLRDLIARGDSGLERARVRLEAVHAQLGAQGAVAVQRAHAARTQALQLQEEVGTHSMACASLRARVVQLSARARASKRTVTRSRAWQLRAAQLLHSVCASGEVESTTVEAANELLSSIGMDFESDASTAGDRESSGSATNAIRARNRGGSGSRNWPRRSRDMGASFPPIDREDDGEADTLTDPERAELRALRERAGRSSTKARELSELLLLEERVGDRAQAQLARVRRLLLVSRTVCVQLARAKSSTDGLLHSMCAHEARGVDLLQMQPAQLRATLSRWSDIAARIAPSLTDGEALAEQLEMGAVDGAATWEGLAMSTSVVRALREHSQQLGGVLSDFEAPMHQRGRLRWLARQVCVRAADAEGAEAGGAAVSDKHVREAWEEWRRYRQQLHEQELQAQYLAEWALAAAGAQHREQVLEAVRAEARYLEGWTRMRFSPAAVQSSMAAAGEGEGEGEGGGGGRDDGSGGGQANGEAALEVTEWWIAARGEEAVARREREQALLALRERVRAAAESEQAFEQRVKNLEQQQREVNVSLRNMSAADQHPAKVQVQELELEASVSSLRRALTSASSAHSLERHRLLLLLHAGSGPLPSSAGPHLDKHIDRQLDGRLEAVAVAEGTGISTATSVRSSGHSDGSPASELEVELEMSVDELCERLCATKQQLATARTHARKWRSLYSSYVVHLRGCDPVQQKVEQLSERYGDGFDLSYLDVRAMDAAGGKQA